MKKILSFFLLLSSLFAFGQEKEIEKAISNGANSKGYYSVDFKKHYSLASVLESAKRYNAQVFDVSAEICPRFHPATPYSATNIRFTLPKDFEVFRKYSSRQCFTDPIDILISMDIERAKASSHNSKVHVYKLDNLSIDYSDLPQISKELVVPYANNYASIDILRSHVQKVMVESNYAFCSYYHGDYYFADIRTATIIALQFCAGNDVDVNDFKTSAKVIGCSRGEPYIFESLWCGDVVGGSPNGLGSGVSLTLNGNNHVLNYIVGKYDRGFPEGQIVTKSIALGNAILSYYDKKSSSKIESSTIDTQSGDGLFFVSSNPHQFYDINAKKACHFEGKILEPFHNGEALVEIYPTFNAYYSKSGSYIKMHPSDLADIKNNIRTFLAVRESPVLSVVSNNQNNFKANSYIKSKLASSQVAFDDHIIKLLESHPEVHGEIGNSEVKRCMEIYYLCKLFALSEECDSEELYKKNIEYQRKTSVTKQKNILDIVFDRTRFESYVDIGEEKFKWNIRDINGIIPIIESNLTIHPGVWNDYKNTLLTQVNLEHSKYLNLNRHESEMIFRNRQTEIIEEIKSENRKIAKYHLEKCRVDGNRSTLPKGIVEADDSWFFGHPAYSEESGTLYLENRDYVEWIFYGDIVKVKKSDIPYMEDEYDGPDAMIADAIYKSASKHYKEYERNL